MTKKRDTKSRSLFENNISAQPEGYYTGDQPNPNLRSFVEDAMTADPPKAVTRGPEEIFVGNRRSALNDLHRFWSKKPYPAIRDYIEWFTDSGDLVFDPFCGSGGVGLVCMLSDRPVLQVDVSPGAVHIAAGYLAILDETGLKSLGIAVKHLVEAVESRWHFAVGNTQYRIEGILYSESYQCDKCLDWSYVSTVVPDGTSKPGVCKCGHATSLRSVKTRFRPAEPVRLYLRECESNNKLEIPYGEEESIWKGLQSALRKAENEAPPEAFLNSPIAEELLDLGGRLRSTGTLKVRDLYTPWGLNFLYETSTYIESIEKKQPLTARLMLFILTSCCLNFSRMYQARRTGGGIAGATFYVPPVFRQINPADSFSAKFKTFCRAQEAILESVMNTPRVCVSCEDSSALDLPPNSVDYIFTDPPYADTMPYGALNCVWEALIGSDPSWRRYEARGVRWYDSVLRTMTNCYRVLKPGGWLSLCYHDTSEGTWTAIQDIMAEAGFLPEQRSHAISIETGQKAFQQIHGQKVTKRDLVINYRKLDRDSSLQISEPGDNSQTFAEKVRIIVTEYLARFPGETKDRIYDEVASRMVRAGEMEPHDFEAILSSIAEIVVTPEMESQKRKTRPHDISRLQRWYLKETEYNITDTAESSKEDAAAESIEAFIGRCLDSRPGSEGVHYSDLFEHYVYSVIKKPRRQLAEFLPDYFIKTEEGTWRPVTTDEERIQKAEARSRGIGRRIKRYVAQLAQGLTISPSECPSDSTLADWIRYCKRSGFYENGKLLYEKGGLNLSGLNEDVQASVEEDYQVCVRMLARN